MIFFEMNYIEVLEMANTICFLDLVTAKSNEA